MTEEVPSKQIVGHCPECGPNRYADILHEYCKQESDAHTWSQTDYRILRCAGCRTAYFQELSAFSEDYYHTTDPATGEEGIEYETKTTYWPSASKRKRPSWLLPWSFEPRLYKILLETYGALDIDARTLAGMGIRTIFDRASEVLGIDPAISFLEKVTRLHGMGKVGLDEKEHLDVLTDAGGASAHRAWEPSLDDIRVLMDIMEGFLYRTFVLTREVAKLKASIPPKQKRQPSSAT